ncbi:hypothetical protein MUU72_16120 [Streptomyces sp. RS10V-4]|uniref:hypothetical protein n=1 Tax=Streptomyces rhizoryzae TaxID=2932493 RepID=UPI0020036D06|nr:hypothetical protein [Streptomyces rhizoryzae]MCK7624607.1 hypothetical protein [Streptomyces rhizoryzae]
MIVSLTVPGAEVRPGDLVAVGGIPHTVVDTRELGGFRKRLQFADGNAYVLARTALIEVARPHGPRGAAPTGRQGAWRRPG